MRPADSGGMNPHGNRFRRQLGTSYGVVVGLHLVGAALLLAGLRPAGGLTLGMALFAYSRGLLHSFDFDHISMIDNSTRKFLAEGRRSASVGLAFSAGHSTVVIASGLLVIGGFGAIRHAFDPGSAVAFGLSIAGVSISGLYLLGVALANLGTFAAAWRLRRRLKDDPTADVAESAVAPGGLVSRMLRAPVARIRHAGHVYVVGLLFSLGFETSSQIGLLMLTASAAISGEPPITLMALPLLFAAAMTLGDTTNGVMMLKMYEHAVADPARRVTFNLVITGVSICSGLLVATLAFSSVLEAVFGVQGGAVGWINGLDLSWAGFALAGLMALIGLGALGAWLRNRRPASRAAEA